MLKAYWSTADCRGERALPKCIYHSGLRESVQFGVAVCWPTFYQVKCTGSVTAVKIEAAYDWWELPHIIFTHVNVNGIVYRPPSHNVD